MRLSAKRILYTVAQSNAMNGMSPSSTIVKVTPGYIIALYTAIVLIGFLLIGVIVLVNIKRKSN